MIARALLSYYFIGLVIAIFLVSDENGCPPKWWHIPFIAAVWPALFFLR